MGYVTRVPGPDDRRAKRIVLTEHGYACVAAAMATIAELDRDLAFLLGKEGVHVLHQQLARNAARFAAGDPPDAGPSARVDGIPYLDPNGSCLMRLMRLSDVLGERG